MQAKRALGVIDAPSDDNSGEALAALSGKLDQMIRLLDESIHLQRVALLEEGNTLRLQVDGLRDVVLALPNAQDDFVQRTIVKTRNFYEARLLATVQGMGLIGADTTVCDVGANIGNHSVFFGRVLGARRVLAFEPQPHCYATLCRNLELNGLTDSLAYNCMVGQKSGRGDVTRFNARNLGGTAFSPAKDGPVPMVALDDLATAEEMKGLGFLKIDTEGMQMEVLQGARKILKAFKPAIWVELLAKENAYPETAKFLEGFGYASVQIGPNDHIFTVRK
jgi:FkbM family methyltransferase